MDEPYLSLGYHLAAGGEAADFDVFGQDVDVLVFNILRLGVVQFFFFLSKDGVFSFFTSQACAEALLWSTRLSVQTDRCACACA